MPKENRLLGVSIALAALAAMAFSAMPATAKETPDTPAFMAPEAISATYLASALPFAGVTQLRALISGSRLGIEYVSRRLAVLSERRPGLDRATTASVPSGFFGTVAVPFSPIGSSKDWDRVRNAEPVSAMGDCASQSCRLRLASAKTAIAEAADERFFARLSTVNTLVNRTIAYAPDQKTYGQLDHWASGAETIRKGAGDCEDFAILKYTLLRDIGVPARSMSLVILRDTARNLYHAVLAISTNKGHFVLDNVHDEVYRDIEARNYLPLYSFSTDRSWIHGVPAGNAVATARVDVPLGSIAPGESSDAGIRAEKLYADLLDDLRPAEIR
jgi:predicted transglutaminase-like cysteine proteinase